jgi:lysophospholipase L1-like esterase
MKASLAALAFALLTTSCAQLPPGLATPPAAVDPAALSAASRWQHELGAFAQADRDRPVAPGGIVFVGSSSIRMWSTLAQDFPQQPGLVNRGFGGSTLADIALLAEPLVVRLRPAQVLLYAGDNDLAEGRSPAQVAADFARFVAVVRAALPRVRIDYIAIKPSPLREALTPQMREANALIEARTRTLPNTGYIDVFTPMLDPAGRPRAELFIADRLHLNEAGYRLWQSAIGPRLIPPH